MKRIHARAAMPMLMPITAEESAFSCWIEGLQLRTPAAMYDQLTDAGYVGQQRARRAVCLMAYRHIRRIQSIYRDGIAESNLPPKDNMLLMGPTGCGKTHLVETLFNKILNIPAVTVDVTGITESGYVGQNTSHMITSLVRASGEDGWRARVGIICIDEFDKLAAQGSTARFAGQGTTKDVSGMGVQKELLKMLGGAKVQVPTDFSGYSGSCEISTRDIAFVACGAFSEFNGVCAGKDSTIGFGREAAGRGTIRWDQGIQQERADSTVNFESYGFLPELIGRFSRIVSFDQLDRTALKSILETTVERQYSNEFELEGMECEIDEGVYDIVVEQCVRKGTGARGLRAILAGYLEDACFRVYSQKLGRRRRIRLRAHQGEIRSEVLK